MLNPQRHEASLTWTAPTGESRHELGDPQTVTVIGRSSSADLRLDDREVSRLHAELRWNGRAWVLLDMDSRNGTYVGPSRVTIGTALNDGDVIRCGRTLLTFAALATAWHGLQTSQPETAAGAGPPPLTQVEQELLQELCAPYRAGEHPRASASAPPTNAELAERLHLTEDGVRQRLKRLYPKFGLADGGSGKRRELAARAVDAGVAGAHHG